MKATIIAAGSRGDVQPYIALGKGLMAAGHAVKLLAFGDFRDLVTAHGLEFVDLGGNLESVAQGMQGLLEQGNMLKILASMDKAARELVHQASVIGLAASRDSNLILGGIGGLFTGVALSEKLGIPFIPAYLYPFTPTGTLPSVLAPVPPLPLPSWANRLTHRLGQQMLWQTVRVADNHARAEVLHLRRAPLAGPYQALQGPDRTILYGYSPQVIPFPRDWGEGDHVTGYWFLDPSERWEPPADLVDFLRRGPAPVYIGFGSMTHGRPEETTELVLRALQLSGQRGILSAGWGGLKKEALPETVCMVGSLPHTWLFPRLAAVVHHGGVGTTASGLRAGVPSVLTPFMGDQPFWGGRVFDLGVGPRPIPFRRLTAERLAEAIRSAVTDDGMRERAARLGERIRGEDGIARAVEVIEQVK